MHDRKIFVHLNKVSVMITIKKMANYEETTASLAERQQLMI